MRLVATTVAQAQWLSLGLFTVRLAQSPHDYGIIYIIVLELFFAFAGLLLRVMWHFRHEIISRRSFRLHQKPRNMEAENYRLATRGIANGCVCDTSLFYIHYTLRFFALPSSVTLGFLGEFLFGSIFQLVSNTFTILTVSYYERIPLEEFDVSYLWSFDELKNQVLLLIGAGMWGMWWYFPIFIDLLDQSGQVGLEGESFSSVKDFK